MKITRWKTVVSDAADVRFLRLIDEGDGKFIFEADAEEYVVLIDGFCGPYVVVPEEYLTKYWASIEKTIGWTFIVEESELIKCFPGTLESAVYKHYVVSTSDTCLEIIAERPPRIMRFAR